VVTDVQVRKLMDELSKHGNLGVAAVRAGMDRGTARRWRDSGQLPGLPVVSRKKTTIREEGGPGCDGFAGSWS